MLDQQITQPVSIDQDHPLRNVSYIFHGRGAESRGSDENSLGSPKANQASDKSLDVGPTYALLLIELCLNIYAIQTEPILVNHAINATIPAPAQVLRRTLMASAIAHRDKQIDNQLLKKSR